MRTTVFCYAAADTEIAIELIGFLTANCLGLVCSEERFVDPADDLLGAAERALSADYVLLLLSASSIPRKLARERWEPILTDEARKFGTQLVYALVHSCEYPPIFRKSPFFDLSQDRLEGQRALKRWLLRHTLEFEAPVDLPDACSSSASAPEVLERLERELADRPGIVTAIDRQVALDFAHSRRDDFEGVFWFNCVNRSRTGVLGDVGHTLGLRLRGMPEQNANALKEFCASRRILLVFENLSSADRNVVISEGSASILFVAGQSTPPPLSLAQTAALFSSWRSNLDACLKALGDVQWHLRKLAEYQGADWQTAISLGSSSSSLLLQLGRLAEAYELFEEMTETMCARGDLLAAVRWDWEKSWILEEWGAPPRPVTAPASQPVQLNLRLGE